MKKTIFVNGQKPALSGPVLNKLQENIEEIGVQVGTTQPTTNEKVWLQKGKNLISGFTAGLFYNNVNHIFETGTSFSTSNFIDVEYGVTYIFSHALNGVGGYVGCFDENGNFLEAINNDTMLTPFTITNANCKKIICISWDSNSNPSANETWMQLEVGNTATEYEEYKGDKIYTKNNNGIYEKFINAENNDYSLGERRIGTWIDGKPLYRKVIIGEGVTSALYVGNNIDTVVDIRASILINNGAVINSPRFESSEDNFSWYYYQDFVRVNIGSAWINQTVRTTAIIEYTLTTDVATTSEE